MSISRLALVACLTIGILSVTGGSVRAGTVGNYRKLDEAGGWNPDVAFDPEHEVYLVVWSGNGISGRFIDKDGEPKGATFRIDISGCYNGYAAAAYNPDQDEFLVTWDNCGIYGQRVRSPDGVLQGGNFAISRTPGGQRSAVAWSSVSQCYMVVYGLANIFAERVSATGNLLDAKAIPVSDLGWYPAVSYSPGSDTFLVSWDYGDYGIGAKRYAAATGAPLGSTFLVNATAADRSHIAHDDALGRWLVQYQDHTAGYDQYVRFVNDDGTHGPGPFPSADTPEFEGETNLGCDIAFSAGAGAYLSVFGTNYGIFGQLLDRNGAKRRARITLGTGDFTYHSNAADPARDRFLTVWSGNPVEDGPWFVYYRLYAVYAPVTGLSALPEPGRIRLTWNQPADSDMREVMIRFSTTAPPAGPSDGTLAAQFEVTPGTGASFVHAGLNHAQTYYYKVFAYDGTTLSYSAGVAASGNPALPGDMDNDHDVDQEDFGRFQACLSGQGQTYQSGCELADLEGAGDGDVDQNDLEVFRPCKTGPGRPPGC